MYFCKVWIFNVHMRMFYLLWNYNRLSETNIKQWVIFISKYWFATNMEFIVFKWMGNQIPTYWHQFQFQLVNRLSCYFAHGIHVLHLCWNNNMGFGNKRMLSANITELCSISDIHYVFLFLFQERTWNLQRYL